MGFTQTGKPDRNILQDWIEQPTVDEKAVKKLVKWAKKQAKGKTSNTSKTEKKAKHGK